MKKKFNIKQFTLIELIIVIVVIGVLAGMALPKFIGTTKDAKVAAMDQDLDTLEKAVQLYESDHDGETPFTGGKVTVVAQTLKDSLNEIGDDGSEVYTLDMGELKPYLERLRYTDPKTDTYLYSTKTNVAINEQGKVDSSGITHHILNGISNTSTNEIKTSKLILVKNSPLMGHLLIKNNNISYVWGNNTYGQLGDGTIEPTPKPLQITLESGVTPVQIVGGLQDTIAIGSNGELYAWGNNEKGQLGIGTSDTNPHSTPTKIKLASGVKPTQIACGEYYSMAIGSDGELYTWGDNGEGQLGDGTTIERHIPTKVTLASGIKPKQIACGSFFSVAIGSDEELYTWGWNGEGELGIGTIDFNEHSTPTKVTLPNGVKPKQIVCGANFIMVIGSDGELYAWGYNGEGELGDGTIINKNVPTKITLASGIKPTQISCGFKHSMAIGDDEELYTWGGNNIGQLGDGTTTNKLIPTKIILAEGIKPTQISCGNVSSMAIGSDENLYIWGVNGFGPSEKTPIKIDFDTILNNTIPKTTPDTPIQLASGVMSTSISDSSNHSIAIGDDDNIYTWGDNTYGQLGDGTTISKETPIKITLPNGVKPVGVHCEDGYSLVLGNDNNVYGFGHIPEGSYEGFGNVTLLTPTIVGNI